MTQLQGGVCAPKGFRAAGLHCGIRKNQNKKDLMLILADAPCAAAAVYTRNKVYGAPITVTRAHLQNGLAQAMLCNSGNANTCNADGVYIANAMCQSLAQHAGITAEDVIIASTGVIGQPLPLEPIEKAMPALIGALSAAGAQDAAEAIMTTDLRPKQTVVTVSICGVECTIGAMAKGSGMIAPNMATMLCFVTTDAAISPSLLDRALHEAVDDTFNLVIVDGDTSTNDMVSILASGKAGNAPIEAADEAYAAFVNGLKEALTTLARAVAQDGEGATKLVSCHVDGAPDRALARAIARSVIQSPLCKTAMFGSDANWGRILCAIGYTPGNFAVDTIGVKISSKAGGLTVCEKGSGVAFSEPLAKQILLESEIDLWIDLAQGTGSAVAWGCDFSYDYVKINGDYRS